MTDGLSQSIAHAESRKFYYLPCGHTDTNSFHDGMATDLATESINEK